jgi:multisubunit Na+/H+ antiporter MnhE subunit
MCLLLAWVLFELDDFWLGVGAGLVTGNLSSWVTARMGAARGERVQRWLLWALVAGVGLSFALLRSAVLTFFLFGALLAVWIHYVFDRYQQAMGSHQREQ